MNAQEPDPAAEQDGRREAAPGTNLDDADLDDVVLLTESERGPEHPGLTSPWAVVVAFVGIASAGALGALVGFAIVNVDTRGTGGVTLAVGALIGGVVAAVGATVVAVVTLRARFLWRRRPIATRLQVEPPRFPRPRERR